MKYKMRRIIINILFSLLGEKKQQLFELREMFGSRREDRKWKKKYWSEGLARAYKNKALIDFLEYQSEADKERVWRGVSNDDVVRGSRIRTLFLVNQMQMAYESEKGGKKNKLKEKVGILNKIKTEFNQITKI